MQIRLADAIAQLRQELIQAMLDGEDQDVTLTTRGIELELAVTFSTEIEAGGGFKLLTFLDLSTKAKAGDNTQHKVKLTLDATTRDGKPLKVRSRKLPKD